MLEGGEIGWDNQCMDPFWEYIGIAVKKNIWVALLVLELQKNNFHGIIHDSLTRENSLEVNLSSNGFEGPVPRSYVHCRELKVLELGNNKFCDEFPSWLEHLPKLHILILRSNRFHGPMLTLKSKFPFPRLRVIDISHNYLKGPLREEYLRNF
ncbi:receptor-like protein 12 [Rhododendron vialii]|uniref:receptor-like protein 12 n=1 Tax=Rhododendron vialii TaxID=182163 RepID=UPI00265F8574|nr:receptor-like protein 12 [Rhododendron vialii]